MIKILYTITINGFISEEFQNISEEWGFGNFISWIYKAVTMGTSFTSQSHAYRTIQISKFFFLSDKCGQTHEYTT